MKNYVIIGGGAASVGCAEGIRSLDREGSITVISGEKHTVYGRPLISYYLQGKTDPERMQYRTEAELAALGVTVLYGRTAVSLDAVGRTVTLDDGRVLPYDALCAATGSRPWNPPFEGLEEEEKAGRVFRFMTFDDAAALEKAVTDASRVLIVGAGLIGLKCAEGLASRAGSITVCDLAPRVLSSILDDDCAALVQRQLEAAGLRILTGNTVQRFRNGTALMQSGEELPFDVLVMAVGVRANTEPVEGAGGAAGRGITVDTQMRTSLPGVWAAGDCAEAPDNSGITRVLALMPNAVQQGRCAGVNMAGGHAVFDKGIPMNAIGFFGLHLMTAGSTVGDMTEVKTESGLRRLWTRDGLLTGMMLIGDTARGGIYTAMIREKTPLDTVDMGLLTRLPTTAAYAPAVRRKMFGSEV